MTLVNKEFYYEIRKAAVSNLTDDAVLTGIAKNHSDHFIRRDATRKLDDQELFAYLARNDESYYVREEAVKRLSDQAVLTEVAKNDAYASVREIAVNKLTDRSTVIWIAVHDPVPHVRLCAAKRFKVQSMIDFINEEPEKCCTKEIIYSLSSRDVNWMRKLSRESLETVLKYLLGLESCYIYLKDNLTYYPVYPVDNDDTIIRAIIAAYRYGPYADLIRNYGGIAVKQHYDHSCYGITIYDKYLPAEYLRDML